MVNAVKLWDFFSVFVKLPFRSLLWGLLFSRVFFVVVEEYKSSIVFVQSEAKAQQFHVLKFLKLSFWKTLLGLKKHIFFFIHKN